MEENRNIRIETKLDKVVDQVSNINIHIAEIKKDLKYHIKRTDILEKKVVPIWTAFKVGCALIGLVSVAATALEIYGALTHAK